VSTAWEMGGRASARRRYCCAISDGPSSMILPGRAAPTTRCGAPGSRLRSCQRCRRGTCTRSTATCRSSCPRRWRSSRPPASIVGWVRRPCAAPLPACRVGASRQTYGALTSLSYKVLVHAGDVSRGIGGRLGASAFLAASITVWHCGIGIVLTTRRARRSLMQRGVVVGAGTMRLLNCA
jgi:hypothetical protein